MPAANFALIPIILKEKFGMVKGAMLIDLIFLMIPVSGVTNFLISFLSAESIGCVIVMAFILSLVLDSILNGVESKEKAV